MDVAVCWFRRNLRLDDNLPLHAAVTGHDAVVPVFVLDDHYLREDYSPPRLRFLAESLAELSRALEAKGSRLLVRKGPPGPALSALAQETGARTVLAHADHEPHGRELYAGAGEALRREGVALRLLEDVLLLPPGSVLTGAGKPFTVFTPFSRRWLEADKPAPVPPPVRVPTPPSVLDPRFPSIPLERPRAFRVSGAPENPPGGEARGRSLWREFRGNALETYASRRDRPDLPGTSRLSPHLRFGTVGIRRVLQEARETWREAGAEGRRSVETFVRELAWREFYAGVLAAFPHVLTGSFRPEYDAFPWLRGQEADEAFAAFREGRTGYPIVDAGVRQLLREGWMHNRVRMIAASFLTKDLLVDWRRGEAFFRERLADGDPASNNGGWQWAAGSGTDAAPFFRVFNPVRQGLTFDPDGAYVRRHVEELARWKAPPALLHAPWTAEAPPRDYPPPVVDHARSRARALAAFARLRARG